MNRIVDPLRGVVSDLVEKRLWPLAVALVAALVAIPIVLGSGSDSPVPAPAPAPSGEAAAVRPAVELKGDASQPSTRAGRLRDPFYDPPSPESAVAAGRGDDASSGDAPSGGPAAQGGGGPSSGGVTVVGPGGGSATGGTSGPTTRTPDRPARRSPASRFEPGAVVDLRFGQTGNVKRMRGVNRLSPLPSSADPFFVFEGMLRGTRTARFLVSEAVKATGDGTCRPSKSNCQRIDLKVGETEYFDLKSDEGASRQYQLDVVSAGRDGRSARRARASRRARSVYRSRVRFGARASARPRGIARLAALGGSADPAMQYLGVGSDRRSAVFVLGPNAHLLSRNACLDGRECRAIALGRGDVASLEVRPAHKPWRKYRLQVQLVVRSVTRSRGAAARARRSAAPGGRAILRRMIADRRTAASLKRFTFRARAGVVARKRG